MGNQTVVLKRNLQGNREGHKRNFTSCTSSATLDLYASSPSGAAVGGIARSILCRAAVLMLLKR